MRFPRRTGAVPEASQMAANDMVPRCADGRAASRGYDGRRIGVNAVRWDLSAARNPARLDPSLTDSGGVPAPRIGFLLIIENSLRIAYNAEARGSKPLAAASAAGICINCLPLLGGCRRARDRVRNGLARLLVTEGASRATCAACSLRADRR